MLSIRPKTYNELMLYQRCLTIRKMVPTITNEICVEIYQHMLRREADPSVRLFGGGKLAFYIGEQMTDTRYLAVPQAYESITLTNSVLSVIHHSSGGGGSDGGSSGNNNNNNNNNNA